MTRRLHTTLHAAALMVALGTFIVGCAGPQERPANEDPPPFRDAALTIPTAAGMVVAGTWSRDDVITALGEGNTVRFDSGHEVRLYRDKRTDASVSPAELVVLISPGGVVQKLRIKPATPLGPP